MYDSIASIQLFAVCLYGRGRGKVSNKTPSSRSSLPTFSDANKKNVAILFYNVEKNHKNNMAYATTT